MDLSIAYPPFSPWDEPLSVMMHALYFMSVIGLFIGLALIIPPLKRAFLKYGVARPIIGMMMVAEGLMFIFASLIVLGTVVMTLVKGEFMGLGFAIILVEMFMVPSGCALACWYSLHRSYSKGQAAEAA